MGDIDEEKLKEGAIAGYIKGLDDEYTEYISKEDMADYMADATGNFVGVGVYMVQDTEANKIMVLSPIKGSPAEKAGLQPGDYIIAVDGVTYTGEQMTEASKIKGETGTTVKLQIQRKDETLDIELTRENIKVNPVEGEVLENNIGYIEFSSFDDGTAEEFKTKFEELQGKGIKSLIIDLRNNGGGIVDEALEIANYILDKDSVILYEVDKNNNETVEKTTDDPIINMPIVILTNENQRLLTLPDGSGLKITSEKYLTPNRTEINKVGIEPDEKVELPETVTNILNVEKNEDTQLQKAIEILK